ncbi:hypothetical protein RJT34_24335 [Clitoria ternatea]|uniref:Uncharacterized protein n=1 Tax=Clitoria ternatea TaxID=43366 RepID=A0AAN9FW80_CLITE
MHALLTFIYIFFAPNSNVEIYLINNMPFKSHWLDIISVAFLISYNCHPFLPTLSFLATIDLPFWSTLNPKCVIH